MIAARAAKFVSHPSSLVVAHFECAKDPYDPRDNPEGYINFGTAENHLLWDIVGPRLAASRDLHEEDSHYGLLYGTHAFRDAVAGLLSASSGAAVDPDALVVASGASAVLDILTYALCDEGDAVLVPTPYYSGFKIALGARAGARIFPAPLDFATGFALSVSIFEDALARARAQGLTVRALIVTSPHNPLGHTHPPEVLRDIIAFARREGIHAIFDELYANSVFGSVPFVSALTLRAQAPERVHVVYGFAKDLGLSGFKVGVLHTENLEVLAATRELAYLCPVSTDTQAVLTRALADEKWVEGLITANRSRLAEAYATTSALLTEHGIAILPADAGLFAWVDLRPFLDAPTFDAERALHARIFEKARVNITPGGAFDCVEPGWFRICYAQKGDVLRVGIDRLGGALRST